MLKAFSFFLVGYAMAVPAGAQITFQNQQVATQPANAKANPSAGTNKMICERQEEIGSRLGGKRVCKTAAQWQEERAQQRRTLEDVQRQATSTGTPAG